MMVVVTSLVVESESKFDHGGSLIIHPKAWDKELGRDNGVSRILVVQILKGLMS